MRQYSRNLNFDQFVYDYKIWNKCRHVITHAPLDPDDPDEYDDDGDRINRLLIRLYNLLFSDAWYTPRTRLQVLSDHINELRQNILTCASLGDMTFYVHAYDVCIALLKEWVLHSKITTKAELIKHLPLDQDCNRIIHDMFKHVLS